MNNPLEILKRGKLISMNKKTISLTIIFFMLILSFSLQVRGIDIKEKTIISGNYTTITINKEISENQRWEYEIEDNDIIEVVSKNYTKQLKTDDKNVINDIHTWYIKALSTGTTRVEFNIVDSSGNPVGEEKIQYKIEVKPKTLKVKPDNLVKIELKENRSTGYTWHLEIEDNNIVKVHHDEFIEPKSEPQKAGQSGIHFWYIQGVNKGKTKLNFELYRDWNKEQIEENRQYIIEVGL